MFMEPSTYVSFMNKDEVPPESVSTLSLVRCTVRTALLPVSATYSTSRSVSAAMPDGLENMAFLR